MMRKRDLRIITDLERFRVLSRDDIVDMYFSHLKNPVTGANIVLKRLVRDRQIEVTKEYSPYCYFPYKSPMKRNSTKIPHFLGVVDIYKQLKQYARIDKFEVEPKFSKGLAEPDAYTRIKGKPFFIELQRNIYSQKVMDEKIKRYEALALSDGFVDQTFLFVIMITDIDYKINTNDITVFQVRSIHDFMNKLGKKSIKEQTRKIKMKIG